MTPKKIRVLVVEDDPEDFKILQNLVSAIPHSRYVLEHATAYQTAVEKLNHENHDIYLVDYRLGPDSGLDFLREAAKVKPDAPVILLTGHEKDEVDMAAMQLGAADFLNKSKIESNLLERTFRYTLERKRQEETLRQREELFRALIENAMEGVAIVDLQGKLRYLSPTIEKILGYRSEEVLLTNGDGLVHAGDIPLIKEAFQKLLQTEKIAQNIEIRVKHKKGGWRTLEITGKSSADVRSIHGVVVNYRDVTERKKAQEKISQLADIVESSNDAIFSSNLDGIIFSWNKGAEKIYQYRPEEIIGRHLMVLSPEERQDEVKKVLTKISNGEFNSGFETVCLRKDGEILEISMTASPVRNSAGKIVQCSIIAQDITERKRRDIQMAFQAAIVSSSDDAIVGFASDGHVRNWNKGAEKVFGYTAEEMVGQPFEKYIQAIVPEDLQNESLNRFETLKNGELEGVVERRRRNKKGDEIFVSMTLCPTYDTNGKIIGQGGIIRDVTGKKKAEESLRRQEEQMKQIEKMNAVGRLAGGVAHDFNNLLSVIGGNSDFLLDEMEPADPRREEVVEIQNAVSRGAELTKQLLVFGQKQVSQPIPVNLNQVSAEMNKMFKRLIDATVDLMIIPGKDLRLIQADPGQIQQVILNLVLNARDAMLKGGQLIIETKNMEDAEANYEGKLNLPPGSYVRLNVTDTGVGMSEEIQKRVFEPFFTTKAEKGTGLGLATVYGIVHQWKGGISLYSKPGLGTTFSVYFPAIPEVKAAPTKPQQIPLILHGSETILVAEDEEAVRKVIVRNLEKSGYRVLEARNGAEAVQKALNYREPIHLLLTDTIMPKMNGRDLADELKRTLTQLKVLFISGYPQEVLSQQGILDPGIHLLQKPFSAEELMKQVRKVLDEK